MWNRGGHHPGVVRCRGPLNLLIRTPLGWRGNHHFRHVQSKEFMFSVFPSRSRRFREGPVPRQPPENSELTKLKVCQICDIFHARHPFTGNAHGAAKRRRGGRGVGGGVAHGLRGLPSSGQFSVRSGVGCAALLSDPNDLRHVNELVLPKQRTTFGACAKQATNFKIRHHDLAELDAAFLAGWRSFQTGCRSSGTQQAADTTIVSTLHAWRITESPQGRSSLEI